MQQQRLTREIAQFGSTLLKAIAIPRLQCKTLTSKVMAQPRSRLHSDSGSITQHMKDLHIKIHRNLSEDKAQTKAAENVSCAQNEPSRVLVGGAGNLNRKSPVSRSVYTWEKSQLRQTQALQRTLSPISVDTKSDSKCNSKSSYPDLSQVINIFSNSPRQGEVDNSKSPDPGRYGNIHVGKTIQTSQGSTSNSPDSGLSVGSDGNASCQSSELMTRQVEAMPFPYPNVRKAFQPVGAAAACNSPMLRNVGQPYQNLTHISPHTHQKLQQSQLLHTNNNPAQFRPLRPLNPDSSSPVCPERIRRPASSPLTVSSYLVERPSSFNPMLTSFDVPGMLPLKTPQVLPSTPKMLSNIIPSSKPFLARSPVYSHTPASKPANVFTSTVQSSANAIPTIQQAAGDGQKQHEEGPPTCSCNRPPKMILCKACGEIIQGRKRQICKAHPNQIFLMDISCCPHCQSENLKEIN